LIASKIPPSLTPAAWQNCSAACPLGNRNKAFGFQLFFQDLCFSIRHLVSHAQSGHNSLWFQRILENTDSHRISPGPFLRKKITDRRP
jgi:hypothetical protein